jgi:hypothetical protein
MNQGGLPPALDPLTTALPANRGSCVPEFHWCNQVRLLGSSTPHSVPTRRTMISRSGSQRTRCLTPRKRDLKSGTVLSSDTRLVESKAEQICLPTRSLFVCLRQQPVPHHDVCHYRDRQHIKSKSKRPATPSRKPQRLPHTTPYNDAYASISQHINNVTLVFPRTDPPLSRVLFISLTFASPTVATS